MALTAKIGIADSQLGNIVPGLGAGAVPYMLYSGVYTLTPNKLDDTLYTSINYPNSTTIVQAILTPYIETGPISDQIMESPFMMPKVGQ